MKKLAIIAIIGTLSTFSFSAQAAQSEEDMVVEFLQKCEFSEEVARQHYANHRENVVYMAKEDTCPNDSPLAKRVQSAYMEKMQKSMQGGANPFALMRKRMKTLK